MGTACWMGLDWALVMDKSKDKTKESTLTDAQGQVRNLLVLKGVGEPVDDDMLYFCLCQATSELRTKVDADGAVIASVLAKLMLGAAAVSARDVRKTKSTEPMTSFHEQRRRRPDNKAKKKPKPLTVSIGDMIKAKAEEKG